MKEETDKLRSKKRGREEGGKLVASSKWGASVRCAEGGGKM